MSSISTPFEKCTMSTHRAVVSVTATANIETPSEKSAKPAGSDKKSSSSKTTTGRGGRRVEVMPRLIGPNRDAQIRSDHPRVGAQPEKQVPGDGRRLAVPEGSDAVRH